MMVSEIRSPSSSSSQNGFFNLACVAKTRMEIIEYPTIFFMSIFYVAKRGVTGGCMGKMYTFRETNKNNIDEYEKDSKKVPNIICSSPNERTINEPTSIDYV